MEKQGRTAGFVIATVIAVFVGLLGANDLFMKVNLVLKVGMVLLVIGFVGNMTVLGELVGSIADSLKNIEGLLKKKESDPLDDVWALDKVMKVDGVKH